MKNIDELNKIFDLTPLPESNISKDYLPVVSSNKREDTEDDYQLARRTLRSLIMKGDSTLDDMINLARNSEHPRSFEVAGQLMKTMSDMTKDLLDLQKKVKELDIEDPAIKTNSIGTQNNIVFAGSTTELLKLLKNQNDDK